MGDRQSHIDNLARVIEAYLSARDQSPRWFALKAGLSSSYVYKILKREDFSPTIDYLTKISDAMGMQLGDLLRQIGMIDTGKPQTIFSTTELFDKIPEEYKELFKGGNEEYLQLAKKMVAAEVDPVLVERIVKAMLDVDT